MKMKKIFKILILLSLFFCKETDNQNFINKVRISEKLEYYEEKGDIFLKSRSFTYRLDKKKLPFQRIIVFNTPLLGYILELGQEQKIVGIAGSRYIYSDKLKTLINIGKIQEIGNEYKFNIEKILALKPDAIFTNYVATFENTYEILKRKGIQIIFLDEYLEQNPLEKVAYLKLFGKLFGVEKKANEIYTEIANNYVGLREKIKKAENNPRVLVGEMYGNHWFMAGGKTYIAHYLKDAHSDYILRENKEDRAIPMSFEEVFVKSQNVEFWTNVGNYSTRKELLAVNPSYEKLPIFQKGKIYSITKRQKGDANDFFERGSVRADWVLKDYVKIFHPQLLPQDTLIYMKELK